MNKYVKRRGFTLIELLIVIIIIAILAGMMMLSSDESSISAKAAVIISDFETIKAAAAAYYLDHAREIENKNWPGFGTSDPDEATNTLWTYLVQTSNAVKKKRSSKTGSSDYFYSVGGKYGTHWFVWCQVPESRVMDKLKARKNTSGLVAPKTSDYHSTESADLGTSTSKLVGICIH